MLWGDDEFQRFIEKLAAKRDDHYYAFKKYSNRNDLNDWKNACSAVMLFKSALQEIQKEKNTPNQSSHSGIQIPRAVLKELMKINFPELIEKVEKELEDNEAALKFQAQAKSPSQTGHLVDIMAANTKKYVFDLKVNKEYGRINSIREKLFNISTTCHENQDAYHSTMNFLSRDSSSRNPKTRYLQALFSGRNRRNEETLQKVRTSLASVHDVATDFAKMDCSLTDERLPPKAVPNVAMTASKIEANKTKIVFDGLMTLMGDTYNEQSAYTQAALRIQGKMQELAKYLEVYYALFLADCNSLKKIQSESALKSMEARDWHKKETEQNEKCNRYSAKLSKIQAEVEAMELELPNFRIPRLDQ